ncbi:CpXC domain-containing protein [Anaerolineales bacterium]
MPSLTPHTIQCPSCGQPFQMNIRTVIDTNDDPEAKIRLIEGTLNAQTCPNCGHLARANTPILYHDASHELLLAYVPAELGGSRMDEERIIGDLMNQLTRNIPKEQFKAYMFNPSRALTLKGMIETILNADGITREMLDEQQSRVNLIQQLAQFTDPETLSNYIQENDAKFDEAFMQTLSMMIQRLIQEGHNEAGQRLVMIHGQLMEFSSLGKSLAERRERQEELFKEVAETIGALGEDATREDFLRLAVAHHDNQDYIEAMVGLVRPVFDYQFLELLSQKIDANDDQNIAYLNLRDVLLEAIRVVDEEAEMAMQQTVSFLQAIVNSPDPAAILSANPMLIDQQFLAILQANMQRAQKEQNQPLFERLRDVYEIAMDVLQSILSPQSRLLSQLIEIEDPTELTNAVEANREHFDEESTMILQNMKQLFQENGETHFLERVERIQRILGL